MILRADLKPEKLSHRPCLAKNNIKVLLTTVVRATVLYFNQKKLLKILNLYVTQNKMKVCLYSDPINDVSITVGNSALPCFSMVCWEGGSSSEEDSLEC